VPGATVPQRPVGFNVLGGLGATEGDQLTVAVFGVVPPVTTALMDPLQEILQVGCVAFSVTVNAGGDVIETVAVFVQPTLSVTVIV
jgi:hypothetical protein